MIPRILFILLTLCYVSAAVDWHGKWDRAGNTWKEKWTNTLNSVNSLPANEKIETLGGAVILGRTIETTDQEQIFRRAQGELLAIPSHAEYFRDRINEAREKLEHAREHENSSMVAYYRGKWDKAREGFTVMSYLPSVETVKVLGEFLGDERGKIVLSRGYSRDDELLAFIKRPHCYSAMLALQRLPIVEKPCKPLGTDYMPDELEPALKPWQQWYQEIKDGKRTFRFEGDPVEYDLNGHAPKDKVERIARDQKREVERQSGRQRATALPAMAAQATTSKRSRPVTIAVLIAFIVLLGSIGCYILRKRRHGARR
jgi:hypothetical protein